MRLPVWLRASVVAAGLYATVSYAGREVEGFEEDSASAQSDEELEAMKAQARGGDISRFGEEVREKPKPFPWMMTLLFASTFAVVAPFAVRMYRRTSAEVADSNAFGFKPKAEKEEAERNALS